MNLRPLWTPSAEALAQLAEQHGFGDEIWTLLFSELKDSFEKSFLLPNHDEDMEDVEEDAEEEDADPWEEERTWRDPSMHKYFLVTSSWSTSKFSVPDQVCASFVLKLTHSHFHVDPVARKRGCSI